MSSACIKKYSLLKIAKLNKNIMEKTIYELELHEATEIKTNGSTTFTVTRVPGGWIYENYRLDQKQMTSVFVPYDNTFQKVPK